MRAKAVIYEINNRDRINSAKRKYYQKNKKKFKGYRAKSRLNNGDRIKEYQREYKIDNRDRRNTLNRDKMKMDSEYRARCLLRGRFLKAVKHYTKTGKIRKSKDYGIDYDKIINHLKPFPADTSLYHIDHIKPLRSFNLEDPDEIKKAFAPENHQWLLAEENLKKGGKLEEQEELLLPTLCLN